MFRVIVDIRKPRPSAGASVVVAPVGACGVDGVDGEDFAGGLVGDGDGGVVGEDQDGCSGVVDADAEVYHGERQVASATRLRYATARATRRQSGSRRSAEATLGDGRPRRPVLVVAPRPGSPRSWTTRRALRWHGAVATAPFTVPTRANRPQAPRATQRPRLPPLLRPFDWTIRDPNHRSVSTADHPTELESGAPGQAGPRVDASRRQQSERQARQGRELGRYLIRTLRGEHP